MAKMGRPSKLNDKQWAEVERKIVSGESFRSVAKMFKISPASISARISERVPKNKELAKSLACVEIAFDNLSHSEQIAVRSLTDTLKSISHHLAGAGKQGAMTAHRLALIANAQVDRVDETAPLGENAESLKSIMALTQGANNAAQIGLSLLAANAKAEKKDPEKGDDLRTYTNAELVEIIKGGG